MMLRCGTATHDITPPPGLPMGGHAARTERAAGVRDSLRCRTVVFDADDAGVRTCEATRVGAALVQCVFLVALERLLAAGVPFVNLPSANVAGTDLAQVLVEVQKCRGRIRHL